MNAGSSGTWPIPARGRSSRAGPTTPAGSSRTSATGSASSRVRARDPRVARRRHRRRADGRRRVRLYHDHMLVKEPGTSQRTPWHQDLPYYNVDGSQNVSMWLPVDPVARASRRCSSSPARTAGPGHAAVVPGRPGAGGSPRAPRGAPRRSRPPRRFPIVRWALEPGDAVFFHMLTLHAAGGAAPRRRRAFSVRFLGDDMVHAPRAWNTSPEFPGLADELPAGAPMDHPRFPVVWAR